MYLISIPKDLTTDRIILPGTNTPPAEVKTLVYRLREVIMKMVCRLHSTYFIVNYIIFGSDSSYAN
jgi:hypothetical protein